MVVLSVPDDEDIRQSARDVHLHQAYTGLVHRLRQTDISGVRRERGVGDAAGAAGGAALLPPGSAHRQPLPALARPAAASMHDEAAQRVPAQLHPLVRLVAHDADGAALRRRRRHLRVGTRLLLDASRYRRPDE